jgi:hypothetical protein
MPRAEARAWWADVEDVKERIEHRRASQDAPDSRDELTQRRTVHITGRGHHSGATARLRLVEDSQASVSAQVPTATRRRPRPRAAERIGARPDRIAGWAVLLGFLLVLIAILSTHG